MDIQQGNLKNCHRKGAAIMGLVHVRAVQVASGLLKCKGPETLVVLPAPIKGLTETNWLRTNQSCKLNRRLHRLVPILALGVSVDQLIGVGT